MVIRGEDGVTTRTNKLGIYSLAGATSSSLASDGLSAEANKSVRYATRVHTNTNLSLAYPKSIMSSCHGVVA